MKRRIASWLHGITADPGRVERCLQCSRRFRDKDPGAWTSYRGGEYPELCECTDRSSISSDGISHVNCRAWGPYCPECAAGIEREILHARELYRD